MRWGYLIPRALLLIGLWAFFAFGFDPTLRVVAVISAEKGVGAKVDIGSVKTSSSPLGISISHVQIANRNAPGTNLIEFDELSLELSAEGLARKSLIVDDGELTGLRWGTPRADSGLLPETSDEQAKREKEAESAAENQSGIASDLESRAANLFGGITGNAQQLLDPNQFESVRMGTELEKKWEANFTQLEFQAKELKAEIDDIERLSKTGDGNKLERLDAYRKAIGEAQDSLKRIKQLKGDVDDEKQQSRSDFANFNAARDRDLAKIRQEVNLFKADPQELAEVLLGPELNRRATEILTWTKWARDHYQQSVNGSAPKRMRGEVIEFEQQAALPRLLIKNLKISGKGGSAENPFEFSGDLTGVTSAPELLGEPAVLQLNAEGPATVDLRVVFDYTHPDAEPTHTLVLSYSSELVPDLKLGDEKSFALDVGAKKLTCQAHLKLVGETIDGELEFAEQQTTIKAALAGKLAAWPQPAKQSMQDAFAAIQEVHGTLGLSGRLTKPKFAIQSNLGEQLVAGFNAALSHQLDQGRELLASQLNDQAAKQTDRLKDLFRQKSQSLSSQLNVNENQVNQLMQQLTGGKLAELDKPLGKVLGGLKLPGDNSSPADVKPASEENEKELKKLFRR